jgi:uncharacterized iron-regulated membrane protein
LAGTLDRSFFIHNAGRQSIMTIDITRRGATRAAAVIVLVLVVVAAAAAFFVGQATRMSDSARAGERATAVAATARTTTARVHTADAAVLQTKLAEQAKAAKTHERTAVRHTRKIERKRAARLARQAAERGYTSGNAAGYSHGHSSGVEDGLVQGSDSLTCSDDPDVTWLPYC